LSGRICIALLAVLTVFGLPDAGEKKYTTTLVDVVDADTKIGIRADGKRRMAQKTKESDEGCPKYKDPLDVTHSAAGKGGL